MGGGESKLTKEEHDVDMRYQQQRFDESTQNERIRTERREARQEEKYSKTIEDMQGRYDETLKHLNQKNDDREMQQQKIHNDEIRRAEQTRKADLSQMQQQHEKATAQQQANFDQTSKDNRDFFAKSIETSSQRFTKSLEVIQTQGQQFMEASQRQMERMEKNHGMQLTNIQTWNEKLFEKADERHDKQMTLLTGLVEKLAVGLVSQSNQGRPMAIDNSIASNPNQGAIKFTILLPDRTKTSYECNLEDTIEHIKSIVEYEYGIAVKDQRIAFNGQELTTGTVHEAGIRNGSIVLFSMVSKNTVPPTAEA